MASSKNFNNLYPIIFFLFIGILILQSSLFSIEAKHIKTKSESIETTNSPSHSKTDHLKKGHSLKTISSSNPYLTMCLACHLPPEKGCKGRKAPPFRGVLQHYRNSFNNNEEAMIKAIASFVRSPDEEKSLMPGAQIKFGLMPPLPLPKPELENTIRLILNSKGDKACLH